MKFSLIHENKLRVTLTATDLAELGMDYGDLDYKNPETRKALVSVLDRGRSQVGFNPRGAKLFVEVYPCEGGGCVLYFTAMAEGSARRGGLEGSAGLEPVLFEFDEVEDLVEGACRAFALYGSRIYRSALYRMGRSYRLVVYPLDYSDRLSVYFLSEYGRRVGEGELLAAYTEEHGTPLLKEEAIETLASYFTG